MELRRVGNSDVMVSPLMMGGAVFGWTVDRETTFAILDRFVAAGYNGLDSAECYSGWVPGHVGGESETEIGHWIAARGNRDKLVISTKMGGSPTDFASGGDLDAKRLIERVEGSLRRLQTDYIDICHAHIEDPNTPIEETLEACDRLQQAGKIRIAGGSNYSLEGLKAALAAGTGPGRYQSYQPQYSLMERAEFEGGYSQVCREYGIGAVCHSTLAKGFLTGNIGKAEAEGSFWKFLLDQYAERGTRVLAALREIAADHGNTMGEVALAWLLHQPGVTAAIFSVEKPEQFDELRNAADVSLSPEEVARLTAASDA